MTTATLTNGKPQRKQLSDQLDRLDTIIDALADGLPGAVADAARDGTRQAVKDAVVEILTNPDIRRLLHILPAPAAPAVAPPVAPPAASKPGLWARLKARVAAAKAKLTAAGTRTHDRLKTKTEAATGVVRKLSAILPLRRILLVAAGAGVGTAAVAYTAPAVVGAVIGGVGGLVTAAVAQVAGWVRKSVRVW